MRRLNPWHALWAIAVLLLATVFILYRIPSGKYILLVDAAHPLAPFVHVQGARPQAGGGAIYYVDVVERRAREFEVLFPWLHPHASFLPASEVVPPGTSSQADVDAELRDMTISQKIGAAVALRRLGYHVVAHPNGVLVDIVELGVPASRKLQTADVIQAVDGSATPTLTALRARLAQVTPGEAVTLRVLRGAKILTIRVRTFALKADPSRALIGIEAGQSAQIKLPIRVSIDLAGVGGPSAGLAFALEVMQKLGKNVTHGYRIAATGEMELNGTVAPIGGVKQKTYGVRQAGADVFLVPAGGNARTARRFAGPLRIIPVRTFAQALHALATLPPKR